MSIFGAIHNFVNPAYAREDTATDSTTSTTDAATVRSTGLSWEDILGTLGTAAESVSTAYRCINVLSDAVGNLPLRYLRLKDDIFVDDERSPFHYLLKVQPDFYRSAFDFKKQIVQHLICKGNAYIVPVRDMATGDIWRLALVNPGCVTHNTLTDEYSVYDSVAGVAGTFREDEIIHIKNYPDVVNGKTGISTLAHARLTLNISGVAAKETLNRFKNGGNVRGIISGASGVKGFGKPQTEQLQAVADDIDARFTGGQKIVSVPGAAEYTPVTLSSTDMQFLESNKFNVREVCRFFGVHPSFVFDDTSNNYKSAEMANVAFLSNTLNPLLVKIEEEFMRKLVPQTLCCKRKFEFDRRGLYAADLDSRVKYQTQTIQAGIYTINDWRRAENQPLVPNGDETLVSANLKSLKELVNPAKPEPTPEPTPEPNEPNNE